MNYIISYADGSSITPDAVFVSAEDITRHLANSGAINAPQCWTAIYAQPRQYRVCNGKNLIYITLDSAAVVIDYLRAHILHPKALPAFEVAAGQLLQLCNDLSNYKQLRCSDIMGIMNEYKFNN